MKILLAEDDQFLSDGLAMILRDSGYTVDVAANGIETDIAVAVHGYDLLILDLGLPQMDGLEILKRMRKRGQNLPVLVLTARDRLEDMVQGLDLGANDYMTKPFQIPELEARIRALLRKDHWANRSIIEFGTLCFNTVTRLVTINGEATELTARELAVLEILLQRTDTPIGKERIADLLSSWDEELTYNAVGIIVHRLRKKLESASITIKSLRGLGYRLEKDS